MRILLLLLLLTSCSPRMGITSIVFKDGTVLAKETEKPKIENGAVVVEGDAIAIIPLESVWIVYWAE